MDHDALPPANIAPQYANDGRSHPSRMHIMGIANPLPPTDGDAPLPLEVALEAPRLADEEGAETEALARPPWDPHSTRMTWQRSLPRSCRFTS